MQSSHCLFLFLLALLPFSVVVAKRTSCCHRQRQCVRDNGHLGHSAGEAPKCKADVFYTRPNGSRLVMEDIEDEFVEVRELSQDENVCEETDSTNVGQDAVSD